MPEQTFFPAGQPEREELVVDSPALSSARSVLSGEMSRLGELIRQEVIVFLLDDPSDIDRVIVAPQDYTLERGACFRLLIVQKEVRMNPPLEDRVSELDILLANKFPQERLSVDALVVPFFADDKAFTSLAPATHPQAITVRPAQDLSSEAGSV